MVNELPENFNIFEFDVIHKYSYFLRHVIHVCSISQKMNCLIMIPKAEIRRVTW